jgi:hypothetical protein
VEEVWNRVSLGGEAATRFPEMSHIEKLKDGNQDERKEVNKSILDNWSFVQVRFLPPCCKGESLPPAARLTINRVKRG